jgi:hypothetical protein
MRPECTKYVAIYDSYRHLGGHSQKLPRVGVPEADVITLAIQL